MPSSLNLTQLLCLILVLISCRDAEKQHRNSVAIRVDHFPQSINYLKSSSYLGHDIQRKTFNELLVRNENGELKPLVAISLPRIVKRDSGYLFEYRIRDEARWDDGLPITSEDIEFSLKALKLPLNENIGISSYYSRIKNVIRDSVSNQIFSLMTVGNKNDLLRLTCDFGILQKSKFDPKGLLEHVSFEDIERNPSVLRNDDKVNSFYQTIIEDGFMYGGSYFHSSGPYQVAGIENGKSITLQRNGNWWANTLRDKFDYIHAGPEEIIYFNIPETIAALYALKNGDIDVMDNIPSSEFVQLENDHEFLDKYNLYSPVKYSFTYVGFNSSKEILNNKMVRRALAHLIDKQDIIESVENGHAQTTIGPINPATSYFYNSTANPIEYDPDASADWLKQAGLKKINDQWVAAENEEPIEFTIIHKQNTVYEGIAQILINEGRKVGIKLSSISYDDRTIRGMLKERNFDITIGSFNGSPYSYNFSGLFGTSAAKAGGMNFTGFGNAKSDSLIQGINYAEDSLQRRSYLLSFQEMLNEECNMVFLYFSRNKIAINKKFTNLKVSSLKPGYDVTAFEMIREISPSGF